MKRKVVLLAFVLLSLCVVDFLELQVAYASPYTDIDVYSAYNMITNGSYPDLVVLDVRRQDEYENGHIYGAVWMPHTELGARIGELAGHENHEIVVYCRSGVRSVTASEILDSHNFTKVYNMLGGIQAWQSAGFPVSVETVHDIAVIDVKPYKTVIGQNQSMSVFATVENQGDTIEAFNVTVYYNTSIVGTQDVNGLVVRTEATLEFTWNTTGLAKGNYTLKTEVSIVPDETDTTDNTWVESVIISILGDVNGDFTDDIFDVVLVATAFGSEAGDENWNANADFNEDSIIDIYDVVTVAKNFGKTDRG